MSQQQHAVFFERVEKHYVTPTGATRALAGIDLSVTRGEIFGLLGPNGSGKTTSIEIMVGLRRATAGKVRVLDLDPVRQRQAIREVVAIQPQHAALFERQTVAELMRAWASFYPAADDPALVISRLGLEDSRRTRIGKLSGGQQQRVLVGLAMLGRPQLLVLDEPSTGLDPNARQELWDALAEYRTDGATVLLSTHSMDEAEALCDRVAILHKGRVVACGSPDHLIREHAPGRQISFTVPPDRDLAVLDRYAADINVVAGLDGNVRVRLNVIESDAVLGILSGDLKARQIKMKDLGLDAVFRRLTGRAFADADADSTGGTAAEDTMEVVA
jgi:ABC-2 type transport system ATP-binding protein